MRLWQCTICVLRQGTPDEAIIGEDLAQGSGEGVRLAHAAVFAAEESVVATGGR